MQTGPRTILITGTHLWNPGDDFVRQGIIRALRESAPGVLLNFLFYDFNPEEIRPASSIRLDNRIGAGELRAWAPHIDAVVVAGLSAGYEVKPLYEGMVATGLSERALLLGGGYENDYAEAWMKDPSIQAVFRRARLVTGRTRRHPVLLDQLGVNYHHVLCPAILSVHEVKDIAPGKALEKILFSIQLPHGMGIPNHASGGAMFDLACRAIIRLKRRFDVALVAHHKSELKQLETLGLDALGPIHFSPFEESLADLYPAFDAVVTTRLHAGLYANGHGLPAIVLNNTERHTHCLDGFPFVWRADTAEALDGCLSTLEAVDLRGVSDHLRGFKAELLQRYVDLLRDPLATLFTEGRISSGPFHPLPKASLPVHFFTIVLNGQPFIRHHIDVFRQLPFDWHWHIIEGVADLKHDTAWSLRNQASIPQDLHHNGMSNDGTSEYLDEVSRAYPGRVTLYRKEGGQFWDGKLEMVNAPLPNLPGECLLWQVDADELWTVDQIAEVRNAFLREPQRQSARFWCHFFVGPGQIVLTRMTYGNHGDHEWLRVHRFRTGARWASHEPPLLVGKDGSVLSGTDVFTQDEMESLGAVFQHMAYAIEPQLVFKESYYGYRGAVEHWRRLQAMSAQEVALKDYFAWVKDEARVGPCWLQCVVPLAVQGREGAWDFRTRGLSIPSTRPGTPRWARIRRNLGKLYWGLRRRAGASLRRMGLRK